MVLSSPPPIRVSEEGSFARFTFENRLPAMIDNIIADNDFDRDTVSRLEAIGQDLFSGTIRPIENDGGADIENWREYVQPFLGQPWKETPFYFAEAYFYRRILEATRYFCEGKQFRVDPFATKKRSSLEQAGDTIRSLAKKLENIESFTDSLQNLLYLNLWGNQADLSLDPSKSGGSGLEVDRDRKYVIIDDTEDIVRFLETPRSRFDIVADNAGFEIVCDLILADFFLSTEAVDRVCLHLKKHPTFVSDATIEDIDFVISFLTNDGETTVQNLGRRLQNFIDRDRLSLRDNWFWNAPLFFWEFPENLHQILSTSDFILLKGDANYRRLVGDSHWEFTTSFSDITRYFPATFATLRTLKSELVVGLTSETVEAIAAEDPDWLIDGNWGVAMFQLKITNGNKHHPRT